MKVWYKAVCDEHKEMMDVFVHHLDIIGPKGELSGAFVPEYLKDKEGSIITWLRLHAECRLRLIWSDEHMDECFEAKYENVKP